MFRVMGYLKDCYVNNGINRRVFSPLWRCGPTRAMASSSLRFLDHTKRRTTVSRTPLDEWSARRRDLYLTTHNTHNRQTSMPPVGFEPTISAGERPQTYALDSAVTGTHSMEGLCSEKTVTYDLLSDCSFQCSCVCVSSSLTQEMAGKIAKKNLSDTITIF